ncbi:MAG TPA: ribulose-phosphate 3-epimerase [Candidatus Nanoarchaeia archaeon]|nr:ribulose-phosphate 3-epimerase [Candidatus Nanoarchaeia archaeon]
MTIIPSIIAKDQKELNSRLKKLKGISKMLHLDIMDGDFVKNKSLWFDFKVPKGNYEAHLMTTRPEMFIGRHHDKIKRFIVHVETTQNLDDTIKFVHSMKKEIVIAINPTTDMEIDCDETRRYLKKIDGVLVMTVNPGTYGAKFIPKMLDRVKELRKMNKKIPIEVDGSMNPNTIALAKKAGATRFSVGSYLQKAKNVKKAYSELQ